MGGAGKHTILPTVALACALGLSACGGGDSSSTGNGSTEASAPTTATQPAKQKQSGNGAGKKSSGKNSGSQQANGNGGSAKKALPKPEQVTIAEGEERSDRFKVKGGDNSIPDYGNEAKEEERAEAQKLVTEFFEVEHSGDNAQLCKLISSKNLASIKALSEQSPKLKGKDCGEILDLMLQPASTNPPYTPKTEVVSLRVENEIAFALYTGIDGKSYAFPMTQEGGEWKLTALAPTPMG